jgi:hypothetical protein
MQLVINNLTGSTRTYLSGAVSVAANSSTSVTNTTQQFQLATDGGLRSDIFSNLASITDGTNSFGAQDAITYLYEILQDLGPLSDGFGNPITSTTVGSKQTLDVNVASTTPPSNLLSTGTLTGTGQTVNLTLQGTASVNIDVSGSGFVGTIVVIENTPSQSRVLGVFNGNSSPIAANITANGNYRVVGLATSATLTVQFSAYTSGSATINIYGSTAPFIVMPYSANAANVLVTSYLNDGSGNALTSTNNALNVSAVSSADTFVTGSITTQDTASTATTGYNGQVWYSGTPTTGSVFTTATVGIETGMVEISGTWTGTLETEVSVDGGTNWIAHSIHQIGSTNFLTTFTGNIAGSLNLAGKTNFRVRATSAITGTVNIRLIESQNVSNVYVANSIKLVDGSSTTSNTMMNIVAASTAASATNTSIVVGLSPNSPLPAGTNSIGTVSSKTQDGSGNSISSYNSQLDTADIINTTLSSGSVTVSTSAVAARVSTSNLTNRKMLTISPTNGNVYLGATSGVTTSTGIPIFQNQVISFSFSANVTPYLIAASSITVNIMEGS